MPSNAFFRSLVRKKEKKETHPIDALSFGQTHQINAAQMNATAPTTAPAPAPAARLLLVAPPVKVEAGARGVVEVELAAEEGEEVLEVVVV